MESVQKRAVPYWALVITVAVLVTAFWAMSPLIDAETLRVPTAATLHVSPWYVIFAPWCNALDALTLLSLRQHVAMITVTLALYTIWRVVRRTLRGGSCFLRELRAVSVLFLSILAIYIIGVILPRPVAKLIIHDPDAMVVDFHSHTDASWDGRKGFDARANRAWHQAAGFDVAYITDHATIAGARVALAHNPARAGDGTTLLLGLEARDSDEHILALNIDTTRDIDPRGQWHDPHVSPMLTKDIQAPLLILSIPGNVTTIPYAEERGNAPLFAVELSDGSPKGVDQVHHDRDRILQLADRLNLAVVSGSDNHGWGAAAVAWSVMHVPGWQSMTPTQINSAICQALHIERRHAVTVIERASPDPDGSRLQLLETPVSVAIVMLRTLSWGERISWIVWAWVVWGVVDLIKRRRGARICGE